MRVLVLANLPPFVLGGAENQVARLVEVWSNMGHRVEVAGNRIPDGLVKLGSTEVRTHRIAVMNRAGRAGRATSYFLSLAILLRRVGHHFDLIYCRGLGDGAVSICLLKSIGETRLPLVACPMNARGAGDCYFLRSIPGYRLLVQLINRHCNALTIIAPAILSDLAELGINRPRISNIPNGIPLGEPIRRPSPAPTRRLIWTGRLAAQKGIDVLLSALADVVAAGREFRLEIIGDGPDRPSLLALCNTLGLGDRIRFSGAIPKELIRAKLAGADVFVLPSRYEGMSNAALEAMEAGLPVLMTRCGGIDDYIDHNIGWICEPNDRQGLAAALLEMLDTPNERLSAMGSQARRLVERRFQIDEIGRQNAALFDCLVHSVRH
jgi:glycosyltransferase involved in cell wall biosynthesis